MSPRLTQLDGLRGLAVVMVVVGHLSERAVPYGGIVGVQVFFVLSGFVITRGLLRELRRDGRIRLGAFWFRRAARLLPAFCLVVVASAVAVIALDDPVAARLARVLGVVVTYTGNWARVAGTDLGPFEHTWSLGVEEQFYLVWPLVLVVLAGIGVRSRRGAFVLALVGLGAVVTWRVVLLVTAPYAHVAYGLDSAAFGLVLGAVASAAAGARTRTGTLVPKVALVLLALLPVCTILAGPGPIDSVTRWVNTAAALLTVPVVLGAARGALPVLDRGPARWFGTISYGLYLWHYPLLRVEPAGVETSGPARVVLVVVAVGIAAASWYGLERPVQRAAAGAFRVSPRRSAGASIARHGGR